MSRSDKMAQLPPHPRRPHPAAPLHFHYSLFTIQNSPFPPVAEAFVPVKYRLNTGYVPVTVSYGRLRKLSAPLSANFATPTNPVVTPIPNILHCSLFIIHYSLFIIQLTLL
jgi:hypothetical protein